MAEESIERKNSFVAVVLSLVIAGLGFVYLGHCKRFAACLLGAFVALFLTLTIMQITGILVGTEVGRFVLFIVMFSFWGTSPVLLRVAPGFVLCGAPVAPVYIHYTRIFEYVK